jgi:hypothetical protein
MLAVRTMSFEINMFIGNIIKYVSGIYVGKVLFNSFASEINFQ